jgi:hypothetical protein
MAQNNTNTKAEVEAKIAGFSDAYRPIAKRLNEIILEANPELQPRLWYGMPGYAKGDGPVLCFFREDKYVSFGLTENAHLTFNDDEQVKLVNSAWFLTELNEATEKAVQTIVRQATA